MLITVLKSKIGRATITQAELHYEGSITVDSDMLEAAGIIAGEKVEVLNINNGSRIETYVIVGKKGSGVVCLNGPAARSGMVGDQVVILSYTFLEPSEVKGFRAKIVKVDEKNRIKN